MNTPAPRALLPLTVLSVAAFARADVAWIDFQNPDSPVAKLHQVMPAVGGASITSGPVNFTLVGETISGRDRDYPDPLLRDFACLDGEGAAISLRITGLPAGNYVIESWHFDRAYPGAVEIACGPAGQPPTVLVPHHYNSVAPALYHLRSDGRAVYELRFKESNDDNRVRLNGLRIRAAEETSAPPGVFIDIDYANTSTISGHPDPFFTTDPADPGFVNGPLWHLRTGFGFNQAGNRDVFEKDANNGVGDAAPLVTIARDLPVGASYGVYVAYISIPSENWQVRGGLAPGKLTLFTKNQPAGRVHDLGVTAEAGSNRNQYLGFLGNATVGPDGALWLYSDDGDGTDRGWRGRTWLEGFYLGAPVLERQ